MGSASSGSERSGDRFEARLNIALQCCCQPWYARVGMAIYHFQAKVIGRTQGRSVVAAAAYRAGEALHDEELGRTHNYLDKAVAHSEIMLPSGAPDRWLDRETLWNEVTARELRRDAVFAREIEVALPRELSQAEAICLVQNFVREQFVARGMVADLNLHWGTASDGGAQPHAHVLLTMRRVVPSEFEHDEAGFGLKERAWNDKALLRGWRERWAELANARLAEVGHDVRIDHRSNFARGIDLAPQNKIGPAGVLRPARLKQAERADEHRDIARSNGERLLAWPELALQALTQQQSTFTRQDLARLVNRQTEEAAQFAAVMAKVEALPDLVRVGEDGHGQARFSTVEMVEVERRMEAAAVGLDRQARHAVPLSLRQVPPPTEKGIQLDAEQLLAFQHVTRARDLAVVAGVAGSGKSTMLGVARQVWAGAGYRVRGAALSGIAAEGLEAGSGIESRTVASLEHAWARGRELLKARDVLVVDEAGMIGSRQMQRVLTAAAAASAKVVLVGDAEQLQAIEAGAAFRAIAERVGVAEITEVRRQRTAWQRDATRELASGRTAAALDRYGAAGAVHGHATLDVAKDQLVALAERDNAVRPGISQIILAHRRVDVADLNRRVRARRQDAGMLGPEQALPMTVGERALAEGDRVYFLRNERGLGVKNGTLGTVRRIDGDGEAARLTVQLDGPEGIGRGRTVGFSLAEYADLDHGYAATVHKAQSVTVDRAYVLATEGMDRHLAYVALSRHRDAVSLHWSADSFADEAALARQLGRERAKDTTLDYAEGDPAAIRAYAERRGLDPRPPPMLPAESLRPATEAEVAALLAERLAAVDRLPDLLGTAYRDPAAARLQLDALLHAHRSEVAVAAMLRQQGPQLLGKLRGSKGMFASGDAAVERGIATMAAAEIPDWIARQSTRRATYEAGVRATLAEQRRQATVEVPGLSPEAAAVLGTLQDAGAAWTLPAETTVAAMVGADQACAAAVAAAWAKAMAKPELGAEFQRFEAAVLERFPEQEQRRGLVEQWMARQALQLSAAVIRLPQQDGAFDTKSPDAGLPALPPAVFAAVFVRMIQHARALTALHGVHAIRVAQDADLSMRATRDRLVEERMAPWWRTENHRWSEWELEQTRTAAKDRVPRDQAEAGRKQRIEAERARIDAQVRALPRAELLRIKAARDEQERQAEAKARAWRAARPSPGYSPRPELE